jgi:Ras GTPase-activating-like protein IQGAP2/3
MIGLDFLKQIIGKTIVEIIKNPVGYEIDSNFVKPEEKIEDNIKKLNQTTQNLIDEVFSSIDKLPYQIKEILLYVSNKVQKKFPEENFKEIEQHPPNLAAVGGILFLRFINPAFVTPQSFGIVESLPVKQATRSLLLITKIIQNLAKKKLL